MSPTHPMSFELFRSRVAEWASAIPEVEAAWLVGSRAWGTPRLDSDWDVLIEASESDYLAGTSFDGWDETLKLACGVETHILSNAVPFANRGHSPKRDGYLLYVRN